MPSSEHSKRSKAKDPSRGASFALASVCVESLRRQRGVWRKVLLVVAFVGVSAFQKTALRRGGVGGRLLKKALLATTLLRIQRTLLRACPPKCLYCPRRRQLNLRPQQLPSGDRAETLNALIGGLIRTLIGGLIRTLIGAWRRRRVGVEAIARRPPCAMFLVSWDRM